MASLKKNFAYSIAYQILVIILPLITAPYISRVLGADGVGEYSYTQSVANYFILMAMLGISQHGNRAVAEAGDNIKKRGHAFWSIYAIQAITNIIAILIYLLYLGMVIGDSSIVPYIQFLYVASGLFDISWLFFGLEKFQLTVIRNTVIKVVTVLAIFIFVRTSEDVGKYTLIMALGTLVSQIYLWLYVRKYVPFTKVSKEAVYLQIKPILVLFLPVLAYSIYKVMDKIMLGAMTDYTQVGYFENAYKINNVPIGLITAIGNVMLPRTTTLIAAGKKEESEGYIQKTFLFVNIVAAPIVFGIAAVSNELITWYYGKGYEDCASLMVCLNWTIFFVAWANIMRTQYLIPNKKDKVYVISTLVGAVVNIILNTILIPSYTAMGAAIGTFFAEFTVMLIQLLSIRKEIKVIQYIWYAWPYFLDALIMFVIVKLVGNFVPNGFIGLLIEVICGAVFYLSFAMLASWWRKDSIYQNVLKLVKKY